MILEAFASCKKKSRKYQRDNCDTSYDVGNQDEKIDRADQTLARKFSITMKVMIEKITEQEQS